MTPDQQVNRRNFLKLAGLTALPIALGTSTAFGFGPNQFGSPSAKASRPFQNAALKRVNVSPNRVIRTVVGLRPFRPTGFVLKSEKIDSKIIVHNYGHGGGGISLSWGTSTLAVDLALQTKETSFAVLGC